MKIALTGGIACGKSMFAKFLRELGIRVIDADDVVHELEAPGGAAVPAITRHFGDGVLAADGGIDRAKLAEIVFLGGQSPKPRTTNHEPRTTSHEPRATNHEPRATKKFFQLFLFSPLQRLTRYGIIRTVSKPRLGS